MRPQVEHQLLVRVQQLAGEGHGPSLLHAVAGSARTDAPVTVAPWARSVTGRPYAHAVDVDTAARGARRATSGWRSPPTAARCASSPAPARARPGSSPAASPTAPHRRRRSAPGPGAHVHPQGGRRAQLAGSGPSGCATCPPPGTFHATAYAQLRDRWAGVGGQRRPRCSTARAASLARILGGARRQATPADLAAEIEWAKARLIRPEDYPAAAAPGRPHTAARRRPRSPSCTAATRRRSASAASSTSTTCSPLCADAIETDPAFAAAQRWRFRHLFVDEYQDVNPLQERLLRAWLGDRRRPVRRRRPEPGHLPVERRRRVVPHRSSPAATPAPRSSSSSTTTGRRRRSCRRPRRCSPATGGRPRPLRANRPDGPVPEIVGYRTDGGRGPRHRPGAARRARPGVSVVVPGGARAHQRADGAHRVGAAPGSASPTGSAGRGAFLDEPEVRDLLSGLERLHEPLATTLPDLESGLARRQADLGVPVDAVGSTGRRRTDRTADAGRRADPDSAVARRLAAHEAVIRLGASCSPWIPPPGPTSCRRG